MATGFEDLGAIEEPKSQPHGFEDLGAVAEKTRSLLNAYPAPAAQDDTAAFADLGAVTPKVRAQQLVADPEFNPAAYAHETGDEDTAFEARELRRNRSFGEKAAEFGGTLLKPETYGHAARSAAAFAGGLVATPLHAIAQAGATAGAPIARAVGADDLANTLENEQQTQGSEALQSAQQIEESLRSLGRGARGLVSGDERARFRDEIAAYRNQLALGKQRPLDTGVVAAASRMLTGNDPSAAFSPEALAAQGARPASPLMIELGAASADPTNLMIPVAGKALPKALAGGITQAAGKALQAPAAAIAYIPKVAHLNKVMKTGSAIGAGVAAYEAIQHPEQAAQIAGLVALGKTLGWLGKGLDAQGLAYRTGTPSPLDIAKAAGRGTMSGNAQRLIGNTAVNAALGVAALEPVDYLQAEGDPRLMAEALIGNAGMGAMFGLPGETFANRQQMQAIQAYRFAQHGAQQLSQNAAYPAHNAVMAKFGKPYQDAINRLRAYLHAGTGTDVLVLDGQSYAQQVGAIGQNTRGNFAVADGVIYLNADSISADPLRTGRHEAGHAIVNFLQNAGRDGEASGLFDAIKAGMTPEQLTTLTSSYRSALSKGTKVAAEQSGLGWEKGEDAAARARVDAAIAEANPEVKILEENLSEIVRDILDGRGVESFSLSKPILERLTDSVAGWMERRGWLNPIDTKAKLGFKAQAVKEAARQAKTLLYETGQRASQAMADGPTAEQEMIRIQREIDAVPPFNPQGVAATEQANAQQRQRLQRELSQWERRGAGIPVPEDAAPPSPDGTPAPAPAADPITTAAEQLRAEGNRTPYPAVRQAMQRNPAAITAEQIVETVKALAVEKQAVKDAITILTMLAYKFTPAEAKQWTDAVIAAHGDPVTDAQKLTLAAARMKRGGQVRPGEFNQQGKPSVPKNIPPFNGPADADGNQATHTVIGESDQPPAWGEYVLTQDGRILRLVKPTVDGKGWSAAAPFGSDSTAGHTVLNDTFTVLETSASLTVRPPSPAQGSTPPTPAPAQAATPAPAAGDLSPSEPTPPGYVTKEGDISTFIRTDGTKVQMVFKNGEWVDLFPQSQETPSGTPQGAPAAIPGLDPTPGAGAPEPPEPPAPKPKGAPIPLAKGPGGVDDILNLIAKMGGIVSRKGTQEFDDMSKRLAGYPIMGGTETPEDLANNLHVNHNIGDGSVVEMWKAIDAAIVGRKSNRLQETQENARQRQAEREHEAQMAKLPADLQEKITRPGGAEMTPDEIAQVQAVFPDFEYQPPENAPEPPTGPAPQPPTGEPVPPRTGVAVAVPVEAPDRNQSTPIRLDEIEQVAASAKAEAVAAEKPKKDGTYSQAAQDRIRKAELMAVIRAHSDRMPLNHEGIRLRTDPFGRETVSGKLDESADFDNWLLNQSSLAGKWDAIGNLLTLQNSLGKTLQIDYGHAPTGEGATTADARRAGIAKATAEDRARGEAPMEVQRKTIVPLEIQYNPGTESFTVLGASPEKLLSNWTHLQEAYGILEEPMPYRDIHDPRLVADMKGYVRNHQNNRQGDGSTMKGKQGERIDPTGPAYPIAEAQFEFLNALMGDESAKSETKQGEAKASLAQFNDRMVNAQAGETNPLRERINAKMREKFGEWPVTDENGNPVPGKFTTWTKGNIENPLSEALRPDLIQAIHQETTRDDASIRPAGYKGDVGRFLGAGIPERGRVAAGFMPEEGSAALIDTKKLDEQIRAASRAKKSAKLAAIIRQIIRDAREQGNTIPTSPNHEQAWAMAKIVNSSKPEYGDAFAEAGRLLRDAGLTNENRSLKELHGQEGYFLNSFGEDFLAGRFDEPIKRGVPNIGVRAQRGFLGRPVPITLPDYDGNKLPSFLPEEAGAENASEAIKARAAKLWKEKGTESPFFKAWSGNLPESTTAKPLPRTGAVIRAFHGTPDASFSVFNENSHFTENEKYADRYQGESASSINVRAKEAKNPKTIAVFIKTEKPFDTRNPQERRVYEREFLNKYGNGTPLSERGLPDWTDSRDMLEWIDEKGLDYDSVILDEGGTPEGGWRGTAIVPRKPTQIKSATGNQGTFDAQNPDIRFLPEDDSPKAKAKTRQRDRDYMKAVEAGDTETAQRMVDEAAKKAGYDLSGIREAAGLYKYYSDKARKTERSEDYDALENFGYKYNEQAVKAGLSESASSQMLSDVGTGMSESDAIHDAIATTQIKSADPIARDDQGNVIPLSERFNPATGDIRYMPEDNYRDRAKARQDDRRRAEDQLRRRLGSAYGSLTPREREQEVAALLRRPERGSRFMPEEGSPLSDQPQSVDHSAGKIPLRKSLLSTGWWSYPKPRGELTKEKIIRALKQATNPPVSTRRLAKFVDHYDSAQDLFDHTYYHGTGGYVSGTAKPSITFGDKRAEQGGGGGYGEKYWAISLSKAKRTAEQFSGQSNSVSVHPVLLKKSAKVIEMPEIQDAADLDDHIIDLWKNQVDAVWIGGGEQELAVINPKAIVFAKDTDSYQVFGGFKSENFTLERAEQVRQQAKEILDTYGNEYHKKMSFMPEEGIRGYADPAPRELPSAQSEALRWRNEHPGQGWSLRPSTRGLGFEVYPDDATQGGASRFFGTREAAREYADAMEDGMFDWVVTAGGREMLRVGPNDWQRAFTMAAENNPGTSRVTREITNGRTNYQRAAAPQQRAETPTYRVRERTEDDADRHSRYVIEREHNGSREIYTSYENRAEAKSQADELQRGAWAEYPSAQPRAATPQTAETPRTEPQNAGLPAEYSLHLRGDNPSFGWELRGPEGHRWSIHKPGTADANQEAIRILRSRGVSLPSAEAGRQTPAGGLPTGYRVHYIGGSGNRYNLIGPEGTVSLPNASSAAEAVVNARNYLRQAGAPSVRDYIARTEAGLRSPGAGRQAATPRMTEAQTNAQWDMILERANREIGARRPNLDIGRAATRAFAEVLRTFPPNYSEQAKLGEILQDAMEGSLPAVNDLLASLDDRARRETPEVRATERQRLEAVKAELEREARSSMPRLPQPRGTLSNRSPLASLHTDLDGKIVEQQKGIKDEIKALTEQIDEYGQESRATHRVEQVNGGLWSVNNHTGEAVGFYETKDAAQERADRHNRATGEGLPAIDMASSAQRAELEEFRRSLVEDHAGLNSLRESLRFANPTTLTEYPRAFAEIRRLEVRGLISHETKERAYDALSERQNTEIARQIIAQEEARPERERQGRIDAKIRVAQREAAKERTVQETLWDEMLRAKEQRAIPKIVRLLRQISRNDEAFQYTTSKAKDPVQIAADISTPNSPITVSVSSGGGMITWRSKNGAISIYRADTDRPEIGAPGAGSQGKKEGGGAQMYKASLDWAINNGKQIQPSNALSEINAYVRRTAAMESSAIQHNTTAHMIPDDGGHGGRSQGVRNWIDTSKMLEGKEKRAADANNIAQLSLRASEQVIKAVPELQPLDFDFKTGKIKDSRTGNEITPADITKILETKGKKLTYERGIGVSTAQRAILIASAIREAEGGALARPDRGRGVRVLKEQGKMFYMPEELPGAGKTLDAKHDMQAERFYKGRTNPMISAGLARDPKDSLARHNAKMEVLNTLEDADLLTDDLIEEVKAWDDSYLDPALAEAGDRRGVRDMERDHEDDTEEADAWGVTKPLFDWVKTAHPETSNINIAGYVLPQGEMLSFSHDGRSRDQDHREITWPYGTAGEQGSGTYKMIAMMNAGAMRIDANSGAISIRRPPTGAQERAILKIVDKGGQASIDAEIADDTGYGEKARAAFEIDDVNEAENVIKRIRTFYRTGKEPRARFMPEDDTVEINGKPVTTGTPITFTYLRNKESATKLHGKPNKESPFDRGFEPSGRYMTVLEGKGPEGKQFETGEVSFRNPIVIPVGEYGETSWKRALSDRFDGKTGKRLSQAILDAGHDGVITTSQDRAGRKYTSEILDLTTFDYGKARFMPEESPSAGKDEYDRMIAAGYSPARAAAAQRILDRQGATYQGGDRDVAERLNALKEKLGMGGRRFMPEDADDRSSRYIVRHLTEAESGKLRKDTEKKLVAIFHELPSTREMAAVALGGEAKRGWYKRSAEAIQNVFQKDAPRFAALLAATSPQTSVESNLRNALNIWKNWTSAGRPIDRDSIVQIMGKSVEGSRGVESVLEAWIPNSVRALGAEDPTSIMLSGPKVDSFMRNLLGNVQEVTNDAWMANYALVDQTIFAGSLSKTDAGKGPGYLAMNAKVRSAAKYLTKLTGDVWTPAEVQETIWSWSKTLYEARAAKGEDRTAQQILDQGGITKEMIAATPDFSTLFADSEYGKILKDAGYEKELSALKRKTRAAARESQGAGAQTGAGAEATSTFAGTEQQRAARRLEKLYRQRQAERQFMPEDTGKPGESGRREENLTREAEAAGINLSLETLKRLTRGDHEAMPGRFGDKRSPDDRAIERWQDGLGTDWKTPSVFFGPDGSGYTDYGPDRVPAAIHKNARLFKGRSSMDFAYKRGLMKQRRPEVEELTGKWTLEEVADHLGDYMELKGRTDTSNPDYAAFQEVAKRELENEGYDGAHWSYEDELSPEQYQIWNKDVIRFMPESLPDDRQRVKQHAVEVAMREIEQDMKDGTVPRTATSFGELQEHTDANLYVNDAERENRRIGPLGKSLGWKPQDYADFTNELIAEIDKRLSTRQRERQHSVQVGDARMTDGPQEIRMPRFLPEELHHGTPHEVDRFTTKKIGTGEGAQAYGWGLYFAQSRAVAKDYAKKLGGEYTVALNADGSPINTEGMSDAAKQLIREATNTIMVKDRSNRESLKVWHESLTYQKETALRWARQGENPESNRAYAKAVDEVLAATKNAKLEHRLAGNLYTVRIKPDADAFLDWDKPLSEQSEKVKAAVKKLGIATNMPGLELGGGQIYDAMRRLNEVESRADELAKKRGYSRGNVSQIAQAASEKLASLGIAGIRYLDQGSRNQGPWTVVFKDGRKIELGTSEAGKNLADAARQEGTLREFIEPPKPTSNYVIFNEADIEITHRNGEPATPAERREAMGEQKFMPEDESVTDEQKDVIKSFIRANNDYDKDPMGVNEDGENIHAYYENELTRLGEAGLTEHQVNGIMGAKTVEDAIRIAERRAREAMQNPALGKGDVRFMPEAPEKLTAAARKHATAKAFADSIQNAPAPRQNNEVNEPHRGEWKPGQLYKDDYGENPFIYEGQDIDPRMFGDLLKLEGEKYDTVVNMPTTQRYIEWYKQGEVPPPITVIKRAEGVENEGKLVNTDRRRVVAAIEAGVKTIPALVEIGRANELWSAATKSNPAPGEKRFMAEDDQRAYEKAGVEVLRDQDTGGKYRVAVKLDDGTVLIPTRKPFWSAHIDAAASLPSEILDRVVDGGFVKDGKWEPGGDLHQGLKKNENVHDYYGIQRDGAGFMPEESAPQPPERPARGAKLPDVMAYGRERRAWIDRFVAWSEKQPRNKPIVLADGDDRTGVITPAIGGGYRITRYLDIDGQQVPHGHTEFTTREEAVKDALTSDGFKGASDRRFMPESSPEVPRQRPDPRSAARLRIDQRGAGFANWTKGTKVVEIPEQHEFKTGEPVTVIGHHGSAVPITAFDVNKAQGIADPQERGIYFLTTKEMPERYAKMASQMGRGKEPTVTSAYLRMENPFVGPRKSFKQLRAEGYDAWIGVPRKDSPEKGVEIAVFNGNQIKSSTDNSGAFDPNNPDIRFMPEAEDIERANRTARAAGAVGSKAITPRYVAETLKPGETVLNFGAGKPDASGKYGHSETIRAAGGLVTEHDFGRNAATAAKDALAKKYDTVFASNVLNVQSGIKMLTETLEQIKSSAKKRAVFNFPESPRYSDLTAEDVAAAIKNTFGSAPKKVGGTNRAPLWEVEITATAPRNAPNAKEAARRRMAARTQQERPEREMAEAN